MKVSNCCVEASLRAGAVRSKQDTQALEEAEIVLVDDFSPTFVYPIFGQEETIFGYKGLSIEVSTTILNTINLSNSSASTWIIHELTSGIPSAAPIHLRLSPILPLRRELRNVPPFRLCHARRPRETPLRIHPLRLHKITRHIPSGSRGRRHHVHTARRPHRQLPPRRPGRSRRGRGRGEAVQGQGQGQGCAGRVEAA